MHSENLGFFSFKIGKKVLVFLNSSYSALFLAPYLSVSECMISTTFLWFCARGYDFPHV